MAQPLSGAAQIFSVTNQSCSVAPKGVSVTDKIVKVKPLANAKACEVRYAAVAGGTPGAWQNGGLYTNSRSMPLNGLTPGTQYQVQVRAKIQSHLPPRR